MAEDDPQKSGSSESSEPSEPSQTLPPQPIAPAQLAVAPQAWWQSAASNAPAAPAAPAGFPATGYPPQSGWWQTPGIGQPSYPAPGWPAAAWGVQSWYGPALYARPGPEPGIEWAGIGARFGALVVDAVLVFASVFVLGFVLAAFGLSSSSSETASSASSASSARLPEPVVLDRFRHERRYGRSWADSALDRRPRRPPRARIGRRIGYSTRFRGRDQP